MLPAPSLGRASRALSLPLSLARTTLPPSSLFSRVQLRSYALVPPSSLPASKRAHIPQSGSYPLGFAASAAHVGIKPSNTSADDLAVIVSDRPCAAAAVFTTNKFQAAPVVVTKEVVRGGGGAAGGSTAGANGVRGVVINSGCANAVTGKGGLEDARRMGEELDRCLGEGGGDGGSGSMKSLVMSTGVIGQRLPIQKILNKIPTAHAGLGNSHAHWLKAARAICTTDTFPKLASRTFTLPSSPGTTFSLVGIAKGAGMIHPNMATLLGVMCTDASVSPAALQQVLTYATDRSFNSISIDGDTSTNDTVALLANGAAAPGGNTVGLEPDSAKDFAALREVVTGFAAELAKLVVRDGEGATKFVTIRVTGAVSDTDARRVAASIGTSPLVKTALYGQDANWGRILCAIGYTPGLESETDSVVPGRTSVSFVPPDGSAELELLVRGEPERVDEARAAEILGMADLEILVKLDDCGEGDREGDRDRDRGGRKGEATFWTCDLSHEYVTINGDYRT